MVVECAKGKNLIILFYFRISSPSFLPAAADQLERISGQVYMVSKTTCPSYTHTPHITSAVETELGLAPIA